MVESVYPHFIRNDKVEVSFYHYCLNGFTNYNGAMGLWAARGGVPWGLSRG
jgi:hypothetical protein